MEPRPFTVALTGGIASGKSAVSARLAELGATVIDADVIARELVSADSPALADIVAAFGMEVIDAAGQLQRGKLRERIFADDAARERLEAILHPRVRDTLERRSRRIDGPYAVLVIPLLVESGEYDWVDRVLVVDATRETQLQRLVLRDGIDADLANAMLDAQATRERRVSRADHIMLNTGTLEQLRRKVDALHARLLALALEKARGRA